MKTFFAWTGCIAAIVSILFNLKSCEDLQNCKNENNRLQVEIGTVNTQNQVITNENIAIRMQRDSMAYERAKELKEYEETVKKKDILRAKRDSLDDMIKTLSATLEEENEEILQLRDSLAFLDNSIQVLEEEIASLKGTIDSLTNSYANMDTTLNQKYWSLVSFIDSFFIPFNVQTISVIPKYETRKKGEYVSTKLKNGIFKRDDIDKIACCLNIRKSDVFLLNLPDSIIEKKEKDLNIFVNFLTIPQCNLIPKEKKFIMGKEINYSQVGVLDLQKGVIDLTFDNPNIIEKRDYTYIFEFYSEYSHEPFYRSSFVTEY